MRAVILLLCSLLAIRSTGQVMLGKVLNYRDEPCPEASICIGNAAGINYGLNKMIKVEKDGSFIISLQPGFYNILVICAGYETISIKHLQVTEHHSIIQNFIFSEPANKNLARHANGQSRAGAKELITGSPDYNIRNNGKMFMYKCQFGTPDGGCSW